MKYPMTKKTDRPLFDYMVMENSEYNYYLYDSFDLALKKAIELSYGMDIGVLYELAFNNETREYRVQNTFTAYDGEVKYDKYARLGLHVQFYVNAGDWLNPNEEWLSILSRAKGI